MISKAVIARYGTSLISLAILHASFSNALIPVQTSVRIILIKHYSLKHCH